MNLEDLIFLVFGILCMLLFIAMSIAMIATIWRENILKKELEKEEKGENENEKNK